MFDFKSRPVDDLLRVMWSLADKHERLRAFYEIDLQTDIPDKTFWSQLWSIWSSHESTYLDNSVMSDLVYSRSGSNSHLGMKPPAKKVFAAMPKTVTVFRGCWEANREGWSWTTDRDVAIWFANRCAHDLQPLVIEAEVDKCDILAVLLGRNEHEAVIDPDNVRVRQVVKLAPLREDDMRHARFIQVVQEGALDDLGGDAMRQMKAELFLSYHIRCGADLTRERAECEAFLDFCKALRLTRADQMALNIEYIDRYRAGDAVLCKKMAATAQSTTFAM